MEIKEATEWLNGKRSMINLIPQEPLETWEVRIAQADAAMTQQAYWIAKAHIKSENLIDRIRTAFNRQLELKTNRSISELKTMFEAVIESVT